MKIKYKIEQALINIRLKIVDVILHFRYDDYCNASLVSWAFGYSGFPEKDAHTCWAEVEESGGACYCGKYRKDKGDDE